MKSNSKDFKTISQVVVDKLALYLEQSQKGQGKVLTQRFAQDLAKDLELEKWIRHGGLDTKSASKFMDTYLANTQHMHHPHYIGHQVAVPHVASGLADLIHGVVNNPMAIYEMGPAAASIERTIINWMLEKVGWFSGSDLGDFKWKDGCGAGVLTHGGSVANLTALSAARANISPEAWQNGTPRDLVILAPEVSHYSIARSISIMGMGKNSIIPVAVNKFEVMKPKDLSRAYKEATNKGKRIMAVIANACATTTGLYDPLDEIGQFCQENKLWFHVDGAHGASALVSNQEKHLLKGVEKANSLIWDTHKMLQTSTLCAAVLFKDHASLGKSFQQKGSYLFHEKEEKGFDIISFAVECTKAGIGSKLFWVLAAQGEQGIRRFVEGQYKKTKEFYTLINAHPDFYCPYYPESNILCFQYTKYGTENSFQLALRNRLVDAGNFYITSAEIKGKRYLRLSVMNKLTEQVHIKDLLNEIISTAKELYELKLAI